MRTFVCILVLSFVSTESAAQVDSVKAGRWSVLPIIFSEPDTGFGFGILPQYIFRASPSARPSRARLDAYYTEKGQFNVTARVDTWLPQNRYRLSGKAQFREWPTSFYGIGNSYLDSLKERYTERSFQLSTEVQRALRPGAYLGARLETSRHVMQENEAGRALDSEEVVGSSGGETLGIGVVAALDTRDETFYPGSGHLIRFESVLYPRLLGTDFGFTKHQFDARKYLRLHGPHVLAFQGTLELSTGSPPFQYMPGAGEVVRGYSSKRYMDRHLLAFQAEYRAAPLVWRFGLALFVGAGQVAGAIGEFSPSRFHLAYGAGIRFQIIQSENINVRWDFGFGDGTSGDYLDLEEAF